MLGLVGAIQLHQSHSRFCGLSGWALASDTVRDSPGGLPHSPRSLRSVFEIDADFHLHGHRLHNESPNLGSCPAIDAGFGDFAVCALPRNDRNPGDLHKGYSLSDDKGSYGDSNSVNINIYSEFPDVQHSTVIGVKHRTGECHRYM